jgi:hypothetical protein
MNPEAKELVEQLLHNSGCDRQIKHDVINLITQQDARIAELERERDEAFAANERDRSFVADARNAFSDALERRTWLLEGRGSYEWDDDRWKDEFRQAIRELNAPMEALGKIGIDWSLCPTNPEEIAAARIDWKARVAELEAALKPFAEEATAYDPPDGGDQDKAWSSYIPIGWLRRARSVLGGKNGR